MDRLTTREVADKLGLSGSRVRDLVAEERIRPAPEKDGGRWTFDAHSWVIRPFADLGKNAEGYSVRRIGIEWKYWSQRKI